MLVVQYGLGIFLNLYVPVPAADQRAGIVQAIANGPYAITVHALLGTALIVIAVVLLFRTIGGRDPMMIALAAGAFGSIAGAFVAGELFVRGNSSSASFAMAMLTGVALLCYVAILAMATVAQRVREIRHTLLDSPVERDVYVPQPRSDWPAAQPPQAPPPQGPPSWLSDY